METCARLLRGGLVAALFLAFAPSAHASRGDLTLAQCLKSTASTGCTAQPSLAGVEAVAVGIGGQSVYAGGGGTLAHFTRDGNGSLTFTSCIANNGPATGCTDLPNNSIEVLDIAVSPDGTRLYTAGQTLATFSLGAGGAPTFSSCLYNDTSFGCADNGAADWGTGLDAVAVSPNSADVYVGGTDNKLSWFNVTASGLTLDSCLSGAIGDECADPTKGSLNGTEDLVLSPDGANVYVAARSTADSVLHLSRGAGGALTPVSCFANAGATNCSDPAIDALDGPAGLAMHPEGGRLYAVVRESNALFDFSLAPVDGALSVTGCLAPSTATNACPKTAGSGWAGANAIEISPDADSLYVTSPGGDSITHFPVAADGSPSGGQCLANLAIGGCADLPGDPLDDAADLAVSPDNKSVYVAAPTSNALTHFTRELGSAPPPADGGGDADGDGVPDATDACSTVFGPASNNGCPVSGGGGGGGGGGGADPADQAACEQAEKKLEKAKAKLKKLKRADAPKSAIKKAKEKVKKVKQAVAEACT